MQLVRSFVRSWLRLDGAIHWLDASSMKTLMASFSKFATEESLQQSKPSPGASNPAVRAVCKYVLEYPEEWLFVFDKYDVPEQGRYGLTQYFSWSAKGNIILTIRTKDVAGEIGADSQQHGNCLEVVLMSE